LYGCLVHRIRYRSPPTGRVERLKNHVNSLSSTRVLPKALLSPLLGSRIVYESERGADGRAHSAECRGTSKVSRRCLGGPKDAPAILALVPKVPGPGAEVVPERLGDRHFTTRYSPPAAIKATSQLWAFLGKGPS